MSDRRPDSLRLHGDRFARAGMLDFAVNVWPTPRPQRLNEALIESLQFTSYPDESAARLAIAHRHGRPVAETLALDGACEAFWLLAHAVPVRHAVCVHPSFTEAEAALRAAGRTVTRLMRRSEDWALDPDQVPEDADLVVLANPNNPTGNLDPPERIARLARPGRTLVVDESFIDFVPGDHSSLAARRELPGLVVLRSLTKVWGLAGLRAGYLLAPADIVDTPRRPPPAVERRHAGTHRDRDVPSRPPNARRGPGGRRRSARGPPPAPRRATRREDVARTGELRPDRGARR